MSPTNDSHGSTKRRAARRVQLNVNFSSGRLEGTGLIQNLSLTGVQIRLLEKSGFRPRPDSMIDLWFSIGRDERPASAKGRVVRSSSHGFAVEFVRLDKKIQSLLLAITNVVAN